jgi:endonuclease/exonuclease/phosphatase family metal-dependent hydrolase
MDFFLVQETDKKYNLPPSYCEVSGRHKTGIFYNTKKWEKAAKTKAGEIRNRGYTAALFQNKAIPEQHVLAISCHLGHNKVGANMSATLAAFEEAHQIVPKGVDPVVVVGGDFNEVGKHGNVQLNFGSSTYLNAWAGHAQNTCNHGTYDHIFLKKDKRIRRMRCEASGIKGSDHKMIHAQIELTL